MIYSMTGYGRASGVRAGREITVELRSVNARYFEYNSRIPRGCAFLDSRLKALVNSRVARGKVELSLTLQELEAAGTVVSVDMELARSYQQALRDMAETLGVKNDATAGLIARFPDVDRLNSSYYPGQGWVEVRITYRDAARVMAYLEGKSDSLSPEDTALYEKAVQVHNSLTDPSMGAYERVKAFHDYLCHTVTYREYGESCYTAYGALVNGAAVCQGYTQAMDLLCYLSGIDCEHIFGSSRGVYHSWVRVLVDGQWYNVDVTWDDQESGPSYDYFLRSDRYMETDHSWTDYPNWPVCPQDYPDL